MANQVLLVFKKEMIEFEVITGAVLGVFFHETIRIRKKANQKKRWVPSFGFGKRYNLILFLITLFVFCLVAAFLSRYVAQSNPIAAFIFGTSVPEGLKAFKPMHQDDEEIIDDFLSDKPSFKDRFYNWLDTYYM